MNISPYYAMGEVGFLKIRSLCLSERINKGMVDLRILSNFELQEVIDDNTMFESRGEEFMKEDAIRNSSLSAMLFMLVQKIEGLIAVQ